MNLFNKHNKLIPPPTFSLAACFPVITPFDVETIEIPSPFKILGKVSEEEYFRKPGVLIRCNFFMTGSFVCLSYFKAIFIIPCLFSVSSNL